jgi:hypothetical protein
MLECYWADSHALTVTYVQIAPNVGTLEIVSVPDVAFLKGQKG